MLRRRLGELARPRARLARELIARADAARDGGQFRDAGVLYAEALRLRPGNSAVAIQAGHMFKEARDFAAAERWYREALRHRPDDADLALQLGHFFKTIDRLPEAVEHYRRAETLVPDWCEPRTEREALVAVMRGNPVAEPEPDDGQDIVPELLPRAIAPPAVDELDRIRFRRLGGRRLRSGRRDLPILSGLEAIRGVCFSDAEIDRAAVLIGGVVVHDQPIASRATAVPGVFKAVFNLWVDCSGVKPGRHVIEVVLADVAGRTRRHIDTIVVQLPRAEAAFPDSDGIVGIDHGSPLSPEDQVRARASIVRPARRSVLGSVRSILVLRTDQLGDMVVSIPALKRLRALFPAARIVCLVTNANADFAATLDMLDEIITVPFPDDPDRRQRVMTRADQEALRTRLAPYRFDVALDLASSDRSRPLLQLSGARFLYGFNDANWPWMNAGLAGGTHDPANAIEIGAQSGRILALVERLGTLADSGATVLHRDGLDPSRLRAIGVGPGERFVVVHAGGRVGLGRWQGYPDLARALLTRGVDRIVALVEDEAMRDRFAAIPGVVVVDRRLAFDDLDILLSSSAAMVGNDSGPKHLASLRGVPVVSIHSARINWNEWGQEQTGVIVSRRVPCAGCAIDHDIDECAKAFACVADIGVQEVLDAVLAVLPPPTR